MSDRSYPHMCRDGHDEVGWRGDDELCPVCRAIADGARAVMRATLKGFTRGHAHAKAGGEIGKRPPRKAKREPFPFTGN